MPKTAIPNDVKPAAAVIAEGKIPVTQLVTAAILLKQEIKTALEDLAKVEAQLIDKGGGSYQGLEETHVVTVFTAVPAGPGKVSYELKADDEAAARKLAGDVFPKLFTRVESFKPVDAFPNVAAAVCTPAKAEKLVELCKRIGKGYSGRCAYVDYPAWLKSCRRTDPSSGGPPKKKKAESEEPEQ